MIATLKDSKWPCNYCDENYTVDLPFILGFLIWAVQSKISKFAFVKPLLKCLPEKQGLYLNFTTTRIYYKDIFTTFCDNLRPILYGSFVLLSNYNLGIFFFFKKGCKRNN